MAKHDKFDLSVLRHTKNKWFLKHINTPGTHNIKTRTHTQDKQNKTKYPNHNDYIYIFK